MRSIGLIARIAQRALFAISASALGGLACNPLGPLPNASAPSAPAAEAVPDPPLRALYEIPFAPTRPGPFADEQQAFDAALAVYRAHGFSESVTLDLNEDVTIPFAGQSAMHSWRFLGDGPAPRAHVDEVSRLYYGGRLAAWERAFASPEEATAGLHAFMLATMGHEIAHEIATERGISTYESDPWREETRAIRFEWLVLRELVARRVVSEKVLADAIAFDRALLAGAPAGLVETLPHDDTARRARFNAGYPYVALGNVAGHEAEVDAVLALYTLARLELAAAPPETWDALAPLLASPPPDPSPMRTEARAFLQREDVPVEGVDLERLTGALKGSQATMTLALTPHEAAPGRVPGVGLEVRSVLAAPLSEGARTALAVLLGRANREHDRVVCDLAESAPVVRCRAFAAGEPASALPDALLSNATRALLFFLRWHAAIDEVAAQGADPLTVVPASIPEVP